MALAPDQGKPIPYIAETDGPDYGEGRYVKMWQELVDDVDLPSQAQQKQTGQAVRKSLAAIEAIEPQDQDHMCNVDREYSCVRFHAVVNYPNTQKTLLFT